MSIAEAERMVAHFNASPLLPAEQGPTLKTIPESGGKLKTFMRNKKVFPLLITDQQPTDDPSTDFVIKSGETEFEWVAADAVQAGGAGSESLMFRTARVNHEDKAIFLISRSLRTKIAPTDVDEDKKVEYINRVSGIFEEAVSSQELEERVYNMMMRLGEEQPDVLQNIDELNATVDPGTSLYLMLGVVIISEAKPFSPGNFAGISSKADLMSKITGAERWLRAIEPPPPAVDQENLAGNAYGGRNAMEAMVSTVNAAVSVKTFNKFADKLNKKGRLSDDATDSQRQDYATFLKAGDCEEVQELIADLTKEVKKLVNKELKSGEARALARGKADREMLVKVLTEQDGGASFESLCFGSQALSLASATSGLPFYTGADKLPNEVMRRAKEALQPYNYGGNTPKVFELKFMLNAVIIPQLMEQADARRDKLMTPGYKHDAVDMLTLCPEAKANFDAGISIYGSAAAALAAAHGPSHQTPNKGKRERENDAGGPGTPGNKKNKERGLCVKFLDTGECPGKASGDCKLTHQKRSMELCTQFANKGKCSFGAACRFTHGAAPAAAAGASAPAAPAGPAAAP